MKFFPEHTYFLLLLITSLTSCCNGLQGLSVLNYFRSVERTLTINDAGLSLHGGELKIAV